MTDRSLPLLHDGKLCEDPQRFSVWFVLKPTRTLCRVYIYIYFCVWGRDTRMMAQLTVKRFFKAQFWYRMLELSCVVHVPSKHLLDSGCEWRASRLTGLYMRPREGGVAKALGQWAWSWWGVTGPFSLLLDLRPSRKNALSVYFQHRPPIRREKWK